MAVKELTTLQRKNRSTWAGIIAGAVAAVKREGMSPSDAATSFGAQLPHREGGEDDDEVIFATKLAECLSWKENEGGYSLPGLTVLQNKARATFHGKIKAAKKVGSNGPSAADQLAEAEANLTNLLDMLDD
jgi:hypothetical protein